MKNLEFNIFTDKQIETIKLIIREGESFDAYIPFGIDNNESNAFGYSTNLSKSKVYSGIVSGIYKTINESNSSLMRNGSNWWGDNSGDVMFFNLDLLECSYQELENWAKN